MGFSFFFDLGASKNCPKNNLNLSPQRQSKEIIRKWFAFSREKIWIRTQNTEIIKINDGKSYFKQKKNKKRATFYRK